MAVIAATIAVDTSSRTIGLSKFPFTGALAYTIQSLAEPRIIQSVPKTPEQWLQEALPQQRQAIFKLFLGYAPGVGKTFSMLSEGIRRHNRGEDVVIGIVETHGQGAIDDPSTLLSP